jgi:hypothetical protein
MFEEAMIEALRKMSKKTDIPVGALVRRACAAFLKKAKKS